MIFTLLSSHTEQKKICLKWMINMNNKRIMGIFAGFTMAIIWGLSFPSIKVAVQVLPPMSLGFARFIVATTVLFIIILILEKVEAGKTGIKKFFIQLNDLPKMIGASLMGVTIYFLCENNGILLISASESSIVIGTIPIITMIAERIFFGIKLSRVQYIGTFLSTVGVFFIVWDALRISSSPKGYLWMLGAVVSWIIYSFITRSSIEKYGRLKTTFWQCLIGALGFIPFLFFEKTDIAKINTPIVLNVLYLGIGCSALCYLLYLKNLHDLGAGVASVFINLIPLITVIASYFILSERLSIIQIIGAIIVIAGIFMATVQKTAKVKIENIQ